MIDIQNHETVSRSMKYKKKIQITHEENPYTETVLKHNSLTK